MLARLRPAPAGAALVLALAAVAFPLPAAASDVECGDVIMEDTVLTHDLDCSAEADADGGPPTVQIPRQGDGAPS